jgi:hypothetical protein
MDPARSLQVAANSPGWQPAADRDPQQQPRETQATVEACQEGGTKASAQPWQKLYRARRSHVHARCGEGHRRGTLLWRQDLSTITIPCRQCTPMADRECRCAITRGILLLTCASTVWMDGMSSPCDTPTAMRAAAMGALLTELMGVSIEAVDHSAKDSISVLRPPQRCAAQPPGTCAHRRDADPLMAALGAHSCRRVGRTSMLITSLRHMPLAHLPVTPHTPKRRRIAQCP